MQHRGHHLKKARKGSLGAAKSFATKSREIDPKRTKSMESERHSTRKPLAVSGGFFWENLETNSSKILNLSLFGGSWAAEEGRGAWRVVGQTPTEDIDAAALDPVLQRQLASCGPRPRAGGAAALLFRSGSFGTDPRTKQGLETGGRGISWTDTVSSLSRRGHHRVRPSCTGCSGSRSLTGYAASGVGQADFVAVGLSSRACSPCSFQARLWLPTLRPSRFSARSGTGSRSAMTRSPRAQRTSSRF